MNKQGTPEWHLERSGHATASGFSDILAKIKSGEAAGRRNYRMRLVTERLTGLPVETYKNDGMDWGTQTEPLARQAVEQELGHTVIETGFVKHRTIPWLGCSPDGLIGTDGLTQIKCPAVSTNHVETLEEKRVPTKYIAQIQGEMWVTGRAWSLYVSYDPRLPEHLRIYSQKVMRDEEYLKGLQDEVATFLAEVDGMHKRLLKK